MGFHRTRGRWYDCDVRIHFTILIPAKHQHQRILDWSVAKELPWGVLILFGGGLALAKGIQQSGLAAWLGEQLTLLKGSARLLSSL